MVRADRGAGGYRVWNFAPVAGGGGSGGAAVAGGALRHGVGRARLPGAASVAASDAADLDVRPVDVGGASRGRSGALRDAASAGPRPPALPGPSHPGDDRRDLPAGAVLVLVSGRQRDGAATTGARS